MPRRDYVICRECGGHRDQVGQLSRHRLCAECGERLLVENIRGMATMTGHVRDRWARAMILAAGGILPERLETRS